MVISVFLFWTNAAQAEMPESTGIPESEIVSSSVRTDRLRINEIFSLDSAFPGRVPEAAISAPEPESSPEDIILERWKNKQMERWSGLPIGKFEINASAYTASADECGNSRGITASGLKVAANRTLACPPSYPFGAKLAIEGFGIFRCEDRGGAIKGNHFDLYMETKKEAFAFGRRRLMAEVVID
jgi:3D (Asp-Asp-Asp) domain-containing protein